MTHSVFAEAFPPDRRTEVAVQGSDAAYVSTDMAVVLKRTPTTAMAARAWLDLQAAIEQWRTTQSKRTDCYLVFVIPVLDQEGYALLRTALDDTLVCRKIVVELRTESLREALMRDFAVAFPEAMSQSIVSQWSDEYAGPTDAELEMLAMRGEEVILDHLIDSIAEAP